MAYMYLEFIVCNDQNEITEDEPYILINGIKVLEGDMSLTSISFRRRPVDVRKRRVIQRVRPILSGFGSWTASEAWLKG